MLGAMLLEAHGSALSEPRTVLLIASLLALGLGPILHEGASRARSALSLLDGFVVIGIGGLVVGHVVPEAVELAGWGVLLAALLGLIGPLMVERWMHNAARRVHAVTLVLAVIGILLHAIVDGVVLGAGELGSGSILALGVVAHRLPVSLTVWSLLSRPYGRHIAAATLGVIASGTIAGFLAGPTLVDVANPTVLGYFQALVGGSLLHVLIHRPHVGHSHPQGWQVAGGLGALVGLAAILFYSAPGHHGHEHGGVWETFLGLALESAPALVLAYLAAGLVDVYLPKLGLSWLRRGGAMKQAAKGVAFGLPLPMCSCGVIPVYRSLVLRGAPATAAMAFFVATPELGLDAILLSIPLLGPHITVARVAAAAIVAILVGWFVGRLVPRADLDPGAEAGMIAGGFWTRMREAVRVGYGEVVDATIPWIVLGVGIAAFIEPMLSAPGSLVSQIPHGWQVAFFAVIGLPAYVCASGATPLVAVLLAHGVSPGAGIAFLLTGPATNVTTFGVLSDLHGRRIAAIFGGTIAALAIAMGYTVDAVLPAGVIEGLPELHMHSASWLQQGALFALAALVLLSLLRQGPRQFIAQIVPEGPAHDHDHVHDDDDHDHGSSDEHGDEAPAAPVGDAGDGCC